MRGVDNDYFSYCVDCDEIFASPYGQLTIRATGVCEVWDVASDFNKEDELRYKHGHRYYTSLTEALTALRNSLYR